MNALTRTHDSSVSVKDTNITSTEHHTEPDTVFKSNKGEIEGKNLLGTTQNADSVLTEVHEKQMDALTHTHDSSLSVKGKIIKTTEHNTEPDPVCKSNKGEITVKHLPG